MIKTTVLLLLIFMLTLLAAMVGCAMAGEQSTISTRTNPDEEFITHTRSPTSQVAQSIPPTSTITFTPYPSASPSPTFSATTLFFPTETAVIPIPLEGDAGKRNAEISGMTWYGDWLILIPQYPNFGGDESRIFALHKDEILDFIDGQIDGPLTPKKIPFDSNDIGKKIIGFEGYEAILFAEDTAYLTIEARSLSGMTGYLVNGIMEANLTGLNIDPTGIVEIKSDVNIANKSYESLLIFQNQLIAIYEANGSEINRNPSVHLFDLNLRSLGMKPISNIEFRITDVTQIDDQGKFWAINYFFPGEPELFAAEDPIAAQFGQGMTHSERSGVERLIELQLDEKGVTLVNNPPIQLELLGDELRNWEGIARLEDIGFLIVTDTFPDTILGFVPFSP